jgi:hypothetical protein
MYSAGTVYSPHQGDICAGVLVERSKAVQAVWFLIVSNVGDKVKHCKAVFVVWPIYL